MVNESKTELKEKLDLLERQLQNTLQLNKQLKDRNNYLQNRLSSIVGEKQEIKEELLKYKAMELDLKSKEVQDFRINYNKMKHRVNVTKSLLDEQREDNIKFNLEISKLTKQKKDLYNIVNGLNTDIQDLYSIIDDMSSNIDNLIDENYLLKDLVLEYQYQSLWRFLKQNKPKNLEVYEEKFNKDLSKIYD